MDVDMLKSSSSSSSADDHHHQHHDQHMDMMEMMMQMQMHNNNPTFPEIDFTWGSNTTNNIEPISPLPMFHNPNLVSSQNSQHFNSSVSFIGAPIQDPKLIKNLTSSGLLSNQNGTSNATSYEKRNSMAAMREMIFRIAAMQPIHIDPESVKPPKRRNVKISKDPQSVAARHRRERISEKIRILQRLVPGGTKMDTASMLDEAIHYVKFLKKQVQTLEKVGADRPIGAGFQGNGQFGNANYSALLRPSQLVGGSMQMLR